MTTYNRSHQPSSHSLQDVITTLAEKVKNRKHLPHVSVERQLELISLLSEFPLGRFFLEQSGGLNGYWTDYIVKHPTKGRSLNHTLQHLHPLETFILDQAPSALATQERFQIFKAEAQKRLYPGAALASIPCGLMSDLLDLDFTHAVNTSLTGVDLDPESIIHAEHYSAQLKLSDKCTFLQQDAWSLNLHHAFDVIVSNGLSIYEADDGKVIELYNIFFQALKPGGTFITSFLTPPPIPGLVSEWKLDAVNKENALLEKIIFSDILDARWHTFRSEHTVRSHLQTAGFDEITLLYDHAHIFPTAVATKPKNSYSREKFAK